jgi:hypothetical protein
MWWIAPTSLEKQLETMFKQASTQCPSSNEAREPNDNQRQGTMLPSNLAFHDLRCIFKSVVARTNVRTDGAIEISSKCVVEGIPCFMWAIWWHTPCVQSNNFEKKLIGAQGG